MHTTVHGQHHLGSMIFKFRVTYCFQPHWIALLNHGTWLETYAALVVCQVFVPQHGTPSWIYTSIHWISCDVLGLYSIACILKTNEHIHYVSESESELYNKLGPLSQCRLLHRVSRTRKEKKKKFKHAE